MTNEEAIRELKILREDYWDEYEDPMPALDMAIKALGQESCEDCISREAVLAMSDYIGEAPTYSNPYAKLEEVVRVEDINALPSIQPKSEIKPIGYRECSDAMLKMWMDNVLTDGEYYRIMDKLNAKWSKMNEVTE